MSLRIRIFKGKIVTWEYSGPRCAASGKPRPGDRHPLRREPIRFIPPALSLRTRLFQLLVRG